MPCSLNGLAVSLLIFQKELGKKLVERLNDEVRIVSMPELAQFCLFHEFLIEFFQDLVQLLVVFFAPTEIVNLSHEESLRLCRLPLCTSQRNVRGCRNGAQEQQAPLFGTWRRANVPREWRQSVQLICLFILSASIFVHPQPSFLDFAASVSITQVALVAVTLVGKEGYHGVENW